ncbi:Hypothetical protein POVN_LOCUS381 [uncultured virus]|nr:Hypothetical protein POVN_LOCUS381 [uncultured virus]
MTSPASETKEEAGAPLVGLKIAIMGRETTMTGLYTVGVGTSTLSADDLEVEVKTGPPLKGPLISKRPLTVVHQENLQSCTGYLESNSGGYATLEQEDGSQLVTKFTHLRTEPFRTFTFETVEEQMVRLTFKYHDGLSCEVKTRVLSSEDATIVLQQYLNVTNNLPFDIKDTKALIVSFQQRRDYDIFESAVPLAAAAKMSYIDETAQELSLSVNVGAVELLPKKSTTSFAPMSKIPLRILDRYADVQLGGKTVTQTLSLRQGGSATLFPSSATLNDAKTDLSLITFKVPRSIPGDEFEVNLGILPGVQIKEFVVNETSYRVTVKSNLAYDTKLRISGWQLKGRKDIFPLRKGGPDQVFTKTFEK